MTSRVTFGKYHACGEAIIEHLKGKHNNIPSKLLTPCHHYNVVYTVVVDYTKGHLGQAFPR